MNRRRFVQVFASSVAAPLAFAERAAARPNILWITCEDMSAHLGCFGDPEARTPHLDALAAEGCRYTHSFAVAGVCAPSRSGTITGMYPTALGTCHMRCNNPPAAPVRCFTAYLREAGYYCTNNVKTDYNFPPPSDAWDESSRTAHWRHRPPAQPFFSVFNITTTHESQIGNLGALTAEQRAKVPGGPHEPARAALPPYYPESETIRTHWAHMYDLISTMDAQAGDILRQLDDDGLSDNTVVFFFSDHGDGLPRAKRSLYDSGIRTPMIVRWPGGIEPRKVSNRLISLVDLGPTVLAIAGLSVPAHMQGRTFLGAGAAAEREYVFAARDRMDERYDIIRAVRDRRFKYVRNYEPLKPYAQYVSYCESWPVMQKLRRAHADGRLRGEQLAFFRERKPIEELYDTQSDPHELANLAADPSHASTLDRLRQAMDVWISETRDLGLVPEPELQAWLPGRRRSFAVASTYRLPDGGLPAMFGRPAPQWVDILNGTDALARYPAIVSIGLMGTAALPLLLDVLNDADPGIAYWAAVAVGNAGVKTPEIEQALLRTLTDTSATRRLGAARALSALGRTENVVETLLSLMKHAEPTVRLGAIHILESFEPKSEAVLQALSEALQDTDRYVPDVARKALGLPPER